MTMLLNSSETGLILLADLNIVNRSFKVLETSDKIQLRIKMYYILPFDEHFYITTRPPNICLSTACF